MQDFNLAALFMLGFLAGGHCLGMCGGIVARCRCNNVRPARTGC